jgi:hypothetical protein
MAVRVTTRQRRADHAAQALKIARSGRVIGFTGQWRYLQRVASMLDGQPGVVVALRRFANGAVWLYAGPPGDGLAPVADRVSDYPTRMSGPQRRPGGTPSAATARHGGRLCWRSLRQLKARSSPQILG